MDLALGDRQVESVEGPHGPESLDHAGHLDRRVHRILAHCVLAHRVLLSSAAPVLAPVDADPFVSVARRSRKASR